MRGSVSCGTGGVQPPFRWTTVPAKAKVVINEGIRLMHFYLAPAVCSASRLALLTGAYPNRVGITGASNHTARHGINPDEMTTAEVLKHRDYATAILWQMASRP